MGYIPTAQLKVVVSTVQMWISNQIMLGSNLMVPERVLRIYPRFFKHGPDADESSLFPQPKSKAEINGSTTVGRRLYIVT